MTIRTFFALKRAFAVAAIIVLPACKDFQTSRDAGSTDMTNAGSGGRASASGGNDGGAATGTGGGTTGTGGTIGPTTDAADAPLDIASTPPDAQGGTGGGGGTGGAGGAMPISDCVAGTTRLCKDDPDHVALGNCGDGTESCAGGHWSACSVQPAAKDSCALQGDDATCNGQPNEGCPCVSGATQACGPAADVGVCKRGTQTCTNGGWGTCVGAVFAAARDCTSSADNNCDGMADNTVDAVCVCAMAATRPCDEHPGKDGTGRCKAGTQTCVIAADKKTSDWGTCGGSVAPAAADTCVAGNDDNCNGVPNEGCSCVAGTTQPCGPTANVGICKRGTQTCTGGTWGACAGAVSAAARDCTSSADNNCDGMPDNTIDAVCACPSGGSQACGQHPGKDGNGPCKAGSQTCVVAADKKSSAWGACSGSVGPAPSDTCGPTDDQNCNGVPHDSCMCANGAVQACGPTAIGICKRGTQTCTGGTWPTTCPGAVTALPRDCTSMNDNDCNGTPDNQDTSTCKCQSGATAPCPAGNDPQCVTGNETCTISADKTNSSWSLGTCALKGSCGTASCANDMLTPTGTCGGSVGSVGSTGSAACNVPKAGPCPNNHACASTTACSQTCSTSGNVSTGCTSTYYCSGGNTCSPRKDDGTVCGSAVECKTNLCGGRCCPAGQPCNCPQPSAQNLFRNATPGDPGFDTGADAAAWGAPGVAEYSPDDADGCIYSGSIQKKYSNDGFGYPISCVNISAGGTYTFGFSLKNPVLGLDVFNCAIFRWSQPNCLGGSDGDAAIDNSYINLYGNAPNWINKSTVFTIPTDGTAKSVQFRCPDSDQSVFIDKVFLSPGASGSY